MGRKESSSTKIKSSKKIKKAAKSVAEDTTSNPTLFDPALDLLFSSSLGPVAKPSLSEIVQRSRPNVQAIRQPSDQSDSDNSDESSARHDTGHLKIQSKVTQDESPSSSSKGPSGHDVLERSRKRKRGAKDDIEGAYLKKLAQEELKEDSMRSPEEKRSQDIRAGKTVETDSESDEDAFDIPQHEAVESGKDTDEFEKVSRTVFLANVSTTAITSKSARKTLKSHLSSFLPTLNTSNSSSSTSVHKLQSIRFRSTAYSSTAIPKRAAFARQELMDNTTTSTNAYAVYTTAVAAREACKFLNGTIVLARHLRVDSVAHPAKIDPKRCVFVGNLDFVDKESPLQNENDEKPPRRPRAPGDVEEGLWLQFEKAGAVKSVRVIRDSKTRIGKGFAYVQFEDGNSVEAALLFNEKKFPPLLPRKLRVSRAKSIPKRSSESGRLSSNGKAFQSDTSKSSARAQPISNRLSKLYGQAGAAKVSQRLRVNDGSNKTIRQPESFVFEGYRASSVSKKKGKTGTDGKTKKSPGKPQNRSSRRGTDWKKAGGKPAAKA